MKKGIVFLILICLTLATKAQKNYFIYLQTDNKQAFSVKMNGKDLSSSASGYIVIPKLPKGEHAFVISFPKNEWPKQSFNILLDNNDQGYMLKNFSGKGWGLFNFQTMDIVMNGDPVKNVSAVAKVSEVEKVNTATKVDEIAKVEKVDKVEKVITVDKVEEVPVAKVATNNVNRTPVLETNPEPEVVKNTPKIVEKTAEIITEKPTPKVEEVPVVKVEKPIVEKVNTVAKVEEVPVVKVDKVEKVNTVAKVEEVPVVKVDKVEKVNTVAKVEEVPVVKVDKVEKVNTVAENTDTPTEKSTTTKTGDVITKVSSFDDIDGVTITYRVVTASGGVDVVPIFLEKSIATTNETDAPKTTEKFIEHIELKNPNENKTEKIEDPTMVKVATNNANRAPVELSKVVKVDKVDKVEVVEKPLKTEKINQGEIIDYAEKIKKVEPVVEKKEEPIKVSTPAVKVEKTPVVKVAEKIEEPVKVTTPVVPEKPVDFGNNNPLKITDAERSSKSSRNITSINSDCADRKATEEDFFKTRKKIIDADSNEDAMVDAALKQFKLKCFSVEQIKNLAIVFLTDEGKYKLVDAAYPYTHESHLYASLEPLFKEAYFLKRFKVMLDR